MSNNIIIAGLTGQTGAGKTTVCKAFEQAGFAVINADLVSRKVVEKGRPCLDEIAARFGKDILLETGELDRKKLGSIVFNDKNKLELLNSTIYPYITEEIMSDIKKLENKGKKFILLDAPTLFESGTDKLCGCVVSVLADRNTRLERIIKRDDITKEAALSRMNSQHDDEFFIKNSGYIIYNNTDEQTVLAKAKETAEKIINGGF